MLNKWLRIGAFLFAGAMQQPMLAPRAAADPYSAEEMLSQCQELLSTAKAAEDPEAIELDNTFATGTCWGAFLSIQQLAALKIAGTKRLMLHVCVPEEATLIQIIQLFDAYARRHPERLGEPFTVVAAAALHDAFPCK